MPSLERFGHRMIRVLAPRYERGAERIVRSAATVAGRTLVERTPVQTARARSNWNASLGAPVFRNDPPPVEGDADAASQKALTQMRSIISLWRVGLGEIHLSNGVPYIVALDQGSSAKAPEGMTAAALAAGRAAVRAGRVLRG